MKILKNKSGKRTKLHINKCTWCGKEFGSYRKSVKSCSTICKAKNSSRTKVGLPPEPSCNKGVCKIPIRQTFCYFDEEDLPIVVGRYWSIRKSSVGGQYAQTNIKAKKAPEVMHRMIMNCPKGFVVDHLDGNGLNNTKANLRICKNTSNVTYSVSRYGTSKFKGVSKTDSSINPWRAYIAPNRKQVSLGKYATEEKAAEAYNEAALKYFGEYALLNDLSSPGLFVQFRPENASDHK